MISGRFGSLPQKLPEVLALPLLGPLEKAVLPLALKEAVVMHDALAGLRIAIRHHGVTHLVIDHVLHEPLRNDRAVEQRVDADHAIALLDRAEDDFVGWPILPLPT